MPELPDELHCSRATARGRRCANRRSPGIAHCRFHSRPAAPLLAYLDALKTGLPQDAVQAIPDILAQTLCGVAEGRISPDTAKTIAYLCQTLLASAGRAENQGTPMLRLPGAEGSDFNSLLSQLGVQSKGGVHAEPGDTHPAV